MKLEGEDEKKYSANAIRVIHGEVDKNDKNMRLLVMAEMSDYGRYSESSLPTLKEISENEVDTELNTMAKWGIQNITNDLEDKE